MRQSVAAAVVYLNGKILITRRAPGEKLSGMWEFLGSKLEADETPQACIVRELREELGNENVSQSRVSSHDEGMHQTRQHH
ncbi:NUDIX domain-containing protein [Pseudomonas aeruginosa]|uniref:NUDIX domain-containing protein n=1 Tax=Pseudomonas aeruginosa TaxID=287 RepID=UPI0009A48CCC|nr:NUDIX domain-containing protein [Pseudomonas aeruginosa]MDI3931688.1 NUDIX domain-containing protein [Pseudomonas aeruginosa]MDV7981254.1 NUDIX domain-containing protein [Pseudomonas aeruginosa]MUI45725.1 NUDIX domain-containing protein [Pseudomonas aeruginosa]MUJ15494.1 NUDIX domain-containing protein [Pseudomonas aeruginosa]RQB35038.1 NUDIX domain-containing protein [Pseudomonas aeruginosa]